MHYDKPVAGDRGARDERDELAAETNPPTPRGLDPILVVLLLLQRLLPVALLAVYARLGASRWLLFGGGVAWALSTVVAARSLALGRVARRRAILVIARGIAERSAPRVRGQAYDALFERLWRAINSAQSLASEVEPSLVASALALPFAFALALVVDGSMIALPAVAAAVVGVATRIPFTKRLQAPMQARSDAYRRLAFDLGHALRALEDLQAQGLSGKLSARLDRHACDLAAAEARLTSATHLATYVPLALGGGTFVAFVWSTVASEPLRGLLHLATLAVLAPIALGLARGLTQRTRLRSDAAALTRLASLPPDLPTATNPRKIESIRAIAWDDVTFCYPPPFVLSDESGESDDSSKSTKTSAASLPVFEHFALTWDATEPLALIGANGSGKSTLLALLLRLVDPTTGRVTIDGVDLREADAPALRARIGYVPQRPLVLEGMTIAEAMRLVAPAADDATLIGALEKLDLPRRLARRGGGILETPCAALSVGEAQRVAVARAIARDAELLVLDEPEAGLDPASRRALGELLSTLAEGGLKIVVATQHDEVIPRGAQVVRLPLAARD